jgi:hypothetical protein
VTPGTLKMVDFFLLVFSEQQANIGGENKVDLQGV